MMSSAKSPMRQSVISFTFDDGRLSTYTNAFPLMRDAGLAGHIALVTDVIGRSDLPHHMGWDHIAELVAAGWEVESHTCSHNLTELTPLKIRHEIVESKEILAAHGIVSKIFSFPGGPWSNQPQFAPGTLFEQTVRRHYAGYIPNSAPHPMSPPIDPYNLGYLCCECYDMVQYSKPIEVIRATVDQTIAAGAWCNLLWHDINEKHLPKFRQSVQYVTEKIRAGQTRCVTMSEYLRL